MNKQLSALQLCPSPGLMESRTLDRGAKRTEITKPTDVDLLLIGKTGNGKSATGNSILKRRAFKSKPSAVSVTLDVAYEVSDFNGRIIKVVDGPGVGDTRLNTERAVHLVMGTMEYAIAANPRGFHAFLLIVRFGGRFTAEDQDTIAFLKKVFGEDFVKRYCILVLTCGDNFETALEETGQSFKEWCDEQEGVFKELLNECDSRVILFDNTTKDVDKKNQQIASLLKIVDNLNSHGNRYTDENFMKAREARDRIIVEAQLPMIQEETMKETSLILQKLEEVQLHEDPENKLQPLEHLQIRTEALFNTITTQDRGTGALHNLLSTVKSIKKSVDDEIKFFYRMRGEREKMKMHEEKTIRMYEEQMRKQKEEYEKRFQALLILEEYRKFEEEHKRQQREMKEKNAKEKEELERKYKKQFLEERARQKKIYDNLNDEYKNIKAEHDKGFFTKVATAVTWPFRKIKGWFSK